MKNKKIVIIDELKKVAEILGKQRFTRDEFIKTSKTPISTRDIESNFGSFANLMIEAGLRPQKHHKISDETLFKAYEEAYTKLGYYPLGHPGEEELSRLTSISGGTFRKRFRGLKNFLFEYKNWLLEKQAVPQTKTVAAKARNIPKAQIVKSENSFDNKQRFTGKATENLVVAELLFRGFNAQLISVDEGIDVFAFNVKNNELYLIQVKHSYYEVPNKSGSITLTVSSFEKNKKSNVYYVFVLERELNKREFLILPFLRVDELLKNGTISKNEGSKQMTFRILHKGIEDAFIGKISEYTDVSRYLNAWDVLL